MVSSFFSKNFLKLSNFHFFSFRIMQLLVYILGFSDFPDDTIYAEIVNRFGGLPTYEENRAAFAHFIDIVDVQMRLYLESHQYCILHPNDPWCGNCQDICKTIPLSYDAKTNMCACPSLYTPECITHRCRLSLQPTTCSPEEHCQVFHKKQFFRKFNLFSECGLKKDFKADVLSIKGKRHDSCNYPK